MSSSYGREGGGGSAPGRRAGAARGTAALQSTRSRAPPGRAPRALRWPPVAPVGRTTTAWARLREVLWALAGQRFVSISTKSEAFTLVLSVRGCDSQEPLNPSIAGPSAVPAEGAGGEAHCEWFAGSNSKVDDGLRRLCEVAVKRFSRKVVAL